VRLTWITAGAIAAKHQKLAASRNEGIHV